MAHHLKVTDHETVRWCRVECTLCGAKHTVHQWTLNQDMGQAAFSKDDCLPPPQVSTAEEEGSTCVEDRRGPTT